MDMQKRLIETQISVLESGVWGTIGKYSVSAAKALADYSGAKYGLLCHSYDAAYEAVLRHFGARFNENQTSDATVVAEVSAPADSLVAVCVGSTPIFADVCETCGMIRPKNLEALLESIELPIRALVLDYLVGRKEDYKLARVQEICRERNIPLILNVVGYIGARHEGRPLTDFCDAAIFNLGKGSAIDVGMSGLVLTNDMSIFQGAFAYHNCGRGFGERASLVINYIVGGDLLVTEWTAAAAQTILEEGALANPTPMVQEKMKGQPVFDTPYAKKQL
jgi:dTDP-4-amino-4,6-dideoxygalactose transaminase